MADQFNCLDQLNSYANYLSANPTGGAPRPQPLLWTELNCAGTELLPRNQAYVNGQTYNNPYEGRFNSLYLPVGWTVTLLSPGGGASITYPLPGTNANLPVLIADFSNILFPGTSQPIKDTMTSIVFNNPQSVSSWQLQMCNNEISTVVGARHLTSYQAGSEECDAFMSGYCHSPPCAVDQVGCAPNSTQPAPLSNACRYCACLVEENCLKQTFCTPGSGDPNCTTNDAFEQFIPVTCFGKNCSIEGYRWSRMQNQRCNITLCQQIIQLVGNDIVIRGGSTMWCGNQDVALVSVTPSAPPDPPDAQGFHLSTWAWVALGVGLFVLAVVVPLAVVLYKRSYTATKSPTDPTPILHSSTGRLQPRRPEFQVEY